MSLQRMNRDQFFARLATIDEQRLRKALWNLYWRGSATVRQRVEAELDPDRGRSAKREMEESVAPESVADEVREFAELARSGAYIGGDRRVSPRERPRWRFTFQRLARDAQNALHADSSGTAASAVAELIELACEMRDHDYFRSEDPVEAARFVVSDAVAQLWRHFHEHYGFSGFAKRAAPQLIRWESAYGWTRSGWDRISGRETTLAQVVASMLVVPDTWVGFADHYLGALDQLAGDPAPKARGSRSLRGPATARERDARTSVLATWHAMLLERLVDPEGEGRLDRLVTHPALGGPELVFLQAQLAYRRGEAERARRLVHDALEKLPGHRGFLAFAQELGAPLPPAAGRIAAER